jgi:hypothetical protein
MENQGNSRINSRPILTPPEISPLDHRILQNGGTTSNIERLPNRTRQGKLRQTTDRARIDELTWENSYLRAEAAHREENATALNEFRLQTVEAFNLLRRALHNLCDKVEKSDRAKAEYWGIDLDEPVCENIL